MRALYFITMILAFIGSFISFNLGMDYINFGYGVNPWAALPVAALMFVAGFILMALLEQDIAADHQQTNPYSSKLRR